MESVIASSFATTKGGCTMQPPSTRCFILTALLNGEGGARGHAVPVVAGGRDIGSRCCV